MVLTKNKTRNQRFPNLGIVQRSVPDSSQARYHTRSWSSAWNFQLHPWLWAPSFHGKFLLFLSFILISSDMTCVDFRWAEFILDELIHLRKFTLPLFCIHCEIFFVEFLSDEINIPSNDFRSDYLRTRYATLLWKYGLNKAETGYVSENDDPTRSKSDYTPPTEDGLVNVE